MTSQKAQLNAKGVGKRYRDVTALRDVTLSFEAGVVTAIFGPNGSGKSTLMRGLCDPAFFDSGSVSTTGGVGFVRQRPVFWERLTVDEQIRYALKLSRSSSSVDAISDAFSLDRVRLKMGHALSGGNQQRLSTALALISDPEICLLDEPESGLDLVARNRTYAMMRQWAHTGRVVVFATHHVLAVSDNVDRIVMLSKGRVIADDTPAKLLFGHPPRWVVDFSAPVDGQSLPDTTRTFGNRVYFLHHDETEVVRLSNTLGTVVRKIRREANLEDVFLEKA